MWTSYKIRNRLENLKNRFHFKMPQMQTLLCQERFLLRLCQLRRKEIYMERREPISEKISAP